MNFGNDIRAIDVLGPNAESRGDKPVLTRLIAPQVSVMVVQLINESLDDSEELLLGCDQVENLRVVLLQLLEVPLWQRIGIEPADDRDGLNDIHVPLAALFGRGLGGDLSEGGGLRCAQNQCAQAEQKRLH